MSLQRKTFKTLLCHLKANGGMFCKTLNLTSWLASHSSCLYITVSHLPPCSLPLGSKIPADLESCVIFVLMKPLPQRCPQPLWFPIGHRHLGVIRNRVTPMGAAARKEAVFATDIHSPFCSHSQQRHPRAEHTWNCRYHGCAGTTLEQHRLNYLQKCFCSLHLLEFSRQRVKLHCKE